ncbi:MAG: hypothetical protein HY655_00115 [Acidobacteria bacterium]|nr:hypothetical protein [Acidobacteriota bacterium]
MAAVTVGPAPSRLKIGIGPNQQLEAGPIVAAAPHGVGPTHLVGADPEEREGPDCRRHPVVMLGDDRKPPARRGTAGVASSSVALAACAARPPVIGTTPSSHQATNPARRGVITPYPPKPKRSPP